MRNGLFDDISIAQISARAGCSVGSFYLRFRNKEAFFEFLIESISETLQAELQLNLTKESIKGLTLAQTVRYCVDQEEARQQLLIGLQIISGHLVNCITHPVNNLPLHDPHLSHWLFEVVMHCLKVKPPVPAMSQQKKGHLRTASPVKKAITKRSK